MCVLEAEPLCWGLDGGHLGVDPKIKIVLAEAAFCNVLCINERKWAFHSNFYFLKGIPPKGQRYIWPLILSQSSSSCVIFVNEIWAFCFTGGNFLLHVGAQIAALVVRWCQANANSGWRCLSVQSSSSAVSLLERYLMPSPSVLMEVSSRKCLVNLWISSWVVSACCFLTDQIMWAELGEDERGGNGTCKQRLM